MSKVCAHLKKMILLAEDVGSVSEITMGDWLGTSDRIYISGTTGTGSAFTITLEIDKEAKSDGN